MICNNVTVSNDGVLEFAGMNTVSLAQKYGTPLYLFDENRVRQNCRTYYNAMNKYFDGNARAVYASKAASFKRIYSIVAQEGMYADAVSVGEIYTAKKAGFPMEKMYFHSNNKTDYDIEFAIDNFIGYFVVDNEEELFAIQKIAEKYMQIASQNDVIFEVNTGAISRGYRKLPYPHENLLHILKKNNSKIILSSDTHSATTIDCYFKETRKMLRDIGFEYTYILYDNEFKKDCL